MQCVFLSFDVRKVCDFRVKNMLASFCLNSEFKSEEGNV